jgi:hypothetical protein
VSGVFLYVVKELKMDKFSFHNCRLIHFHERLLSYVAFGSFCYKQYEWILMLGILIVLDGTGDTSVKNLLLQVTSGAPRKCPLALSTGCDELLQ